MVPPYLVCDLPEACRGERNFVDVEVQADHMLSLGCLWAHTASIWYDAVHCPAAAVRGALSKETRRTFETGHAYAAAGVNRRLQVPCTGPGQLDDSCRSG
jgi:hypothetical protein